MPTDHFGPATARTYDRDEWEMFTPEALDPVIDVLVGLAGGGPALELGIGTGRVALPLAARGVEVHGIDLSTAMLEQLAAKPGGTAIHVTVGDFATTRLGRTFQLAYLVFNTIMNLTTQDEQVACFAAVADHLDPGGHFVIEVMVPALQGLAERERGRVFALGDDHLGVDEYDQARQGLVSHHVRRNGDGSVEMSSTPFRYVWPSELDLMARLAGLALRHRWGDWHRAPFTNESRSHISVWQKQSG